MNVLMFTAVRLLFCLFVNTISLQAEIGFSCNLGNRSEKSFRRLELWVKVTVIDSAVVDLCPKWPKNCEQELISSWDGRPFDHNRYGPKIGGRAPFWGAGGAGSHLTQCRLGRGLPPRQMKSNWSIQSFCHNRDGPKIGEGCAPFGGAGSPSNTMSPGPDLPLYHVVSWRIQPFGHNRHRPKIRGCGPFWGELGPHLTQCYLGRGLPPYQMAS